jgi:hypothetical protein
METKNYTVLKAGRIQGIWREEGITIPLTDAAAKYPLLSGQIVAATNKGKGK